MIDNAVRSIALGKKGKAREGEVDEFERWKNRQELYRAWKQKHRIDIPGKEVKLGERVDVRDTEFIWCLSTIELKISTIGRKPLLYIHYNVIIYFLLTY
jgi:hypothetical protein